MNGQYKLGIIGMGVMGRSLALNFLRNGFTPIGYDLNPHLPEGFPVKTVGSLEDLTDALHSPRILFLMVPAGAPVDAAITSLKPHIQKGDLIIDGGNSYFADTERRYQSLESEGFRYIGMGVSGGESGALWGPSLMPGGSKTAWQLVQPMFEAISVKTENGEPCAAWMGSGGAGHYVKMVHNGIEYGDMQLICEAYQVMRDLLKMTADEMHLVFKEWNEGDLNSYLIEITRDILAFRDTDGHPLVDKILDTAGQKGTGKWTGIAALDLGIPLTLIGEAVFSRCLSAVKDERVRASKILHGPDSALPGKKSQFLNDLRDALYASKIVSYAQGYSLMKAAAEEYNWDLNYGGIALMWRGGCIIRSAFLGKIKEAFNNDPSITNLLLDPFFKERVEKAQEGWRRIVASAISNGIPVPAMSSALGYFDGYRCEKLPANLLQAQRDYFGAHTYERTDKPRGEFFHTNWTGRGGATSSSTYNV